MIMTGKDAPIPEDVREAFDLAAASLFAWSVIGGDEPTVVVHGSLTLISNVATLAKTYKDMMPADLYWRMVRHANCSPRRRLQASKLSLDSSYATGVNGAGRRHSSRSKACRIASPALWRRWNAWNTATPSGRRSRERST
jgi:hypothetical protein